ncbi:MAG: LptF/LptG family permease [Treponema sp.]|nr:LptF/LptG family permease [Treponema sp.]
MMTLDRYLARQFLPIFIIASFMFVMIVILLDLFTNLWRYLNYEASIQQILTVSYYYIPKSFSYALPVSLLFSAGYTLGDLYGRNELTSVFSSGISFWRFCMPLIVIGVMASFFAFRFDNDVVIPTLKIKNDLSRKLLHQSNLSENNSDIVVKSKGGTLIYSVDYYDYTAQILNGVSVIEQNEDGSFSSLVRASDARWNGEYWELSNAIVYRWEDGFLRAKSYPSTDGYRESPDTFRRNAVRAEELPAKEALLLIKDLKSAGLPFITAEADYHHRYSFSCTSFVVMLLSISMGGRFRKNILLMTMASSLVAATIFYVMDMIAMMMAKLGNVPPIAGAWFPVFFFVAVGFLLMKSAKT